MKPENEHNMTIVENAAKRRGTSIYRACKTLDKSISTFSVAKNRDNAFSVTLYADFLAACGHALVVTPVGEIPEGAEVIWGNQSKDGFIGGVPDDNELIG